MSIMTTRGLPKENFKILDTLTMHSIKLSDFHIDSFARNYTSANDAARAYENKSFSQLKRETILRRWIELSIQEINEAINTNEAVKAYLAAHESQKRHATDKIIKVSQNTCDIIQGYACLWHMNERDGMLRYAASILIERLSTMIASIKNIDAASAKAKVAYDEAVYFKYISKDDPLPTAIANYIIANAASIVDLVDGAGEELPHDQCQNTYGQKVYEYMAREIDKATSQKALNNIAASHFFSKELRIRFDEKMRQIKERDNRLNNERRSYSYSFTGIQ